VPRSGPAACDGIALVNVPMLIDAGYGSELRVLLLNADRTAAGSTGRATWSSRRGCTRW
jgi:dUTPase